MAKYVVYAFFFSVFFFFNDTATTEIYTLSLHDALPILGSRYRALAVGRAGLGRGSRRRATERRADRREVLPRCAARGAADLEALPRAALSALDRLHRADDLGRRAHDVRGRAAPGERCRSERGLFRRGAESAPAFHDIWVDADRDRAVVREAGLRRRGHRHPRPDPVVGSDLHRSEGPGLPREHPGAGP